MSSDVGPLSYIVGEFHKLFEEFHKNQEKDCLMGVAEFCIAASCFSGAVTLHRITARSFISKILTGSLLPTIGEVVFKITKSIFDAFHMEKSSFRSLAEWSLTIITSSSIAAIISKKCSLTSSLEEFFLFNCIAYASAAGLLFTALLIMRVKRAIFDR